METAHMPHVRQLARPPAAVTEQALCAWTDPETFFPEKGRSPAPAKDICTACPVIDDCLDWALTNKEPYGVWGGLTAQERRRLHRNREDDAS